MIRRKMDNLPFNYKELNKASPNKALFRKINFTNLKHKIKQM
jgi:hypothetical protein